MKKNSKSLLRLLKIFLAVLIVALLIYLVDVDELLELILQADWVFFSLALLLVFFIRILMAIRWQAILCAENIDISFSGSLYINLISQSAGFISPGGLGADVVRGGSLYVQNKGLGEVAKLLIIDRMVGVLGMALVASFGLIYTLYYLEYPNTFELQLTLALSLVLMLAVFVAPWILNYLRSVLDAKKSFHKAVRRVVQLAKELTHFRYERRLLIYLLGLSVFMQVCRGGVFLLLFLSISVVLEPIVVFALTPVVFIMMLIPVSIGGFGVRELTTYILFKNFGVSLEQCVVLGLLFYSLQLIMVVPGIVMLLLKKS